MIKIEVKYRKMKIKKKFEIIGFITWVLAGVLVLPVSFYLSMVFIKVLDLGAQEDQLAGFFIVPLAIGGILLSQWLILRQYLDKVSRWIVFTLLSWVVVIGGAFLVLSLLSHRLEKVDPISTKFFQAIYFSAIGAIIGGFQALALRGSKRAYLLIPANIVAIFLIMLAIGKSIHNTFEMGLVSGIPALTTGIALIFILGGKVKPKKV